MKGRFYGIGVGPGDPELLTLKGQRLLKEVAVLSYPEAEAGGERIALSIVSSLVQGEKEHLPLVFPMTRDQGALEASRWEAARQVLAQLHEGKDVAFVTLGDPSFYSTYGYLVRRIRQMDPEVRIETVPGVTAFCAGAAALNLPLGEGNDRVAIVPSVEDISSLPQVLQSFESVVLMKVHREFPRVIDILAQEGRKDDAFFLSRVGQPGGFIERDLDLLRERNLDYLSMIIVGGKGGGK